MKRVVLTRFSQEFEDDGSASLLQVQYSTYETGESFNATINLTKEDVNGRDLSLINAVQADKFARTKLRTVLANPGLISEEIVEG